MGLVALFILVLVAQKTHCAEGKTSEHDRIETKPMRQ